MEKNRYLSTADASRVLGVTPATIRLMARRGDLPVAAMTEGGIHLFRRAAVERLAKRRAKRKQQAERLGGGGRCDAP
jgi:excisionase family DNA binding protein